MTRRDLLDQATSRLTAAGIDGPRRTAEWMLEETTGADRLALISRPDVPVELHVATVFQRMVERRLAREPVQYVVGHADFYGLRLAVTPAVLIPRPETEEVVEEALRRIRGHERPYVLDVGTGSGAIALAVKHERPDAEVFALDVSPDALRVASANAARLGLTVTFVRADALRPQLAAGVPPTFDLVVSNPPYVPESEREGLDPEVRDHEPGLALFVGDADPLRFYRALAGHAEALLRPGGWLVAETHADYGRAVCDVFAQAGFVGADVLPDLAGRDRIAVGQWTGAAPA